MSGFSVEWLALREPVDHRSVNADLRARFARDLAGIEGVTLTDIGCGSGSHLRSLAPFLGARQVWRLVDYDADLLAAACVALTRWADSAAPQGDALALSKDGRSIEVSFVRIDLAARLEEALEAPCHAVTAAAFFDLASCEFIERLAQALARRKLPLYTILTYDGRETWTPAHPADGAALAAFHAHQRRDKGFGPAAGPGAVAAMSAAFAAQGYAVSTGESPWRLGPSDRLLMGELARGAASAIGETGRLDAATIRDWLAHKVKDATACEIGHVDLYARPMA